MLNPKVAPEMPLASPRLAPETVLMSLVLSALSTAGVLECGLCSFLMAGRAGRWLRGCFKTTSSFFSAAVAGSMPCALLGRFAPVGLARKREYQTEKERQCPITR